MKSEKSRITNVHNDPDCRKEVVTCSICHNFGHKTRHLNYAKNKGIDLFNTDENTRFHILYAVTHACFSENKAVSRNQWCYYGEDTVGRDEVYFTVRLKNEENRLPEFVTERQREAQDFEPWIYDDPYIEPTWQND